MRAALIATVLLAGCQGYGSWEITRPPLELTVDEPVYGAFLGDGPAIVSGRVSDPDAIVWIEGREAKVGGDGAFRVVLPVDGPYRVLDVEAASPLGHLRERRPVFSGEDPMAAWPGAITLRMGPAGLDGIAGELATLVDGFVGFLFPEPTTVALDPSDEGLAATIGLNGAVFSFEIAGFAISLGLEEVVLGATLLPAVLDGNLVLQLTDSTLELGDPVLEAGALDPLFLEDLVDDLLASVSGTIEGFVDDLVGSIGTIPVGGPFAFETDLLGSPMSVSVDALYTDDDGIGGTLGVVLGDDPAPTVRIPAPGADAGYGRADVALGVHEGLLQLLLTSELLALLEQDLELGGILADVLGLTISSLPGGSGAPDPEAWCVKVTPGPARAARLQGGTDPLAKLYLPDLIFEVGYSDEGVSCADWLVASLELEVDVAVREGTKLDLGLGVAGGTVLEYGTDAPWEEAEVIAGLGGLLETLVDLVGGQLELDLAEILGGGLLGTGTGTGTGGGLLGEIEPAVITSEPLYGEDGPVDGLYALSLQLWD